MTYYFPHTYKLQVELKYVNFMDSGDHMYSSIGGEGWRSDGSAYRLVHLLKEHWQ